METMNVALPESMKSYVQERVSEGGYSSVSEYVRALIRADQQRIHDERIDALLIDGLRSGEPIEANKAYWDRKRRKLNSRRARSTRS